MLVKLPTETKRTKRDQTGRNAQYNICIACIGQNEKGS